MKLIEMAKTKIAVLEWQTDLQMKKVVFQLSDKPNALQF